MRPVSGIRRDLVKRLLLTTRVVGSDSREASLDVKVERTRACSETVVIIWTCSDVWWLRARMTRQVQVEVSAGFVGLDATSFESPLPSYIPFLKTHLTLVYADWHIHEAWP